MATKDQWKKAKRHLVTLASGTEVEIELPNVPLMIKAGLIPNELVEIAVKQFNKQDVDVEMVTRLAEFTRFIISKMVVKPAIDAEDVEGLPAEDIDILTQLANRERDIDAVGHHIAGLETNAEWRKFRGFSGVGEDGVGL